MFKSLVLWIHGHSPLDKRTILFHQIFLLLLVKQIFKKWDLYFRSSFHGFYFFYRFTQLSLPTFLNSVNFSHHLESKFTLAYFLKFFLFHILKLPNCYFNLILPSITDTNYYLFEYTSKNQFP